MRRYIHLDMDAFFASVEQCDNPRYRGIPLAVGGSSAHGGRGVVATASYEARAFGVRSAMSAREALQRCPHLAFARPRFDRYNEISQGIRSFASEYSTEVQMLSIDECLLDVTELPPGFASATAVAAALKARISMEWGLTASAGVAPLRFLAKIASEERKPDGLTVISPARVRGYLDQLELQRIPGVGPKTAARLRVQGVSTGRDLIAKGEAWSVSQLGSWGESLFRKVTGLESERALSQPRQRKQVGAERTCLDKPLQSQRAILSRLLELSSTVARALLRQQRAAATLTLKARNAHFQTTTVSTTVNALMRSERDIYGLAMALYQALSERDSRFQPAAGIRLLGLSASNLTDRCRGAGCAGVLTLPTDAELAISCGEGSDAASACGVFLFPLAPESDSDPRIS